MGIWAYFKALGYWKTDKFSYMHFNSELFSTLAVKLYCLIQFDYMTYGDWSGPDSLDIVQNSCMKTFEL